MDLIQSFQAQVILAAVVIMTHFIMCYFDKERKLNIFEGDNISLVVFIFCWFVICTFARYWMQLPLLGWIGYFT